MLLLLGLLFVIGVFSGTLTGLLSVGGGVILIAGLLVIMPLFKIQLSMQTIAGLSITQSFFTTLFGSFYYIKSRQISQSIILYLGFSAMVGGASGSYLASFVPESILKVIFVSIAMAAAIAMLFPAKNLDNDDYRSVWSAHSKALAIFIGLATGVLGGLIGVAAGFVFVPVIVYVFKLSLRKAIGSSLVTCFLLVLGGFIVKLGMQSVTMQMAAVLVCGGIIGSQIGGWMNKFIQTNMLKKMIAIVIGVISIKIFCSLFY